MGIVFVDRDGVINRNRDDYVKSWEEFEFLPGALAALRRLALLRFRVVVVTNQSVVNRGIVSREAVEAINRQMIEQVAAQGGRIEAVFFCPHRPDEECDCRKPRPGLLLQASKSLDLDLSTAYLIGDHLTDVEAARSAGCRASVLVLTGRHEHDGGVAEVEHSHPAFVADDLQQAVDIIVSVGQV